MSQLGLDVGQLAESYRLCERIAKAQAKNFYPAFRLLPRQKRLFMCALYAFMRVADDIVDEPGSLESKQQGLDRYRQQVAGALSGDADSTPLLALADTVAKCGIPAHYLQELLDGVEMDLRITTYPTFADLYAYCYRVAGVVGLCCIHVWGFVGQEALAFAESAGIAFQLTNILRDLGEDAAQGRIYLPQEDFAGCGYDPAGLLQAKRDPAFHALMRLEADRANAFYREGAKLLAYLEPGGRVVFQVMLDTYWGLLKKMEATNFDVFSGRVRVSGWRKAGYVLRALPLRFGRRPGG